MGKTTELSFFNCFILCGVTSPSSITPLQYNCDRVYTVNVCELLTLLLKAFLSPLLNSLFSATLSN